MSLVAPQESALLGAAQWVEGLLASPLVTGIATLAVAGVGLAMLGGRIAIRRAGTVAFGCFLLVGASSLARGLAGAAANAGGPQPVVFELSSPPPPPVQSPPPQNVATDPYAGATISG